MNTVLITIGILVQQMIKGAMLIYMLYAKNLCAQGNNSMLKKKGKITVLIEQKKTFLKFLLSKNFVNWYSLNKITSKIILPFSFLSS